LLGKKTIKKNCNLFDTKYTSVKENWLSAIFIFPERKDGKCKIHINQNTLLFIKSFHSTLLLHNSEAFCEAKQVFRQLTSFLKTFPKVFFNRFITSNHRINLPYRAGSEFCKTNGTAGFKIFSLFSCGCCSRLLNVKPT